MFFEDPAKRYPHLAQALNLLSRRSFSTPMNKGTQMVLLGSAAAFGLAIGSAIEAAFAVAIATAVFGFFRFREARSLPPIQVDARAVEATEVARRMNQMLSKRRIHRDLDEASLLLLEESARQWFRAKSALEAPFWTSSQVPVQYQGIRRKAIEALDEAMDDVLLHYRMFVPDEVQNRNPLDYVDEALEQFTFKGRQRPYYPPAAFGPVREIAEKLSILADEAERLSREVHLDPAIAHEFAPGRSLDETLAGLREIREAEEELRQNLRS